MTPQTQFTPGPWTIDPNGEIPDRPYMVGRALYCVADVGSLEDAKLIASAPSLYAALKDLIDVCEGIDMWVTQQAAKDARKALDLASPTPR